MRYQHLVLWFDLQPLSAIVLNRKNAMQQAISYKCGASAAIGRSGPSVTAATYCRYLRLPRVFLTYHVAALHQDYRDADGLAGTTIVRFRQKK